MDRLSEICRMEFSTISKMVRLFIVSPLVLVAQPPTNSAATGTLLFDTNAPCRVSVDGEDVAHVAPDQMKKITAARGEHIVSAVSDDGGLRWKKTVLVKEDQQSVVTIEFEGAGKAVASEKPAAQGRLVGSWEGRYKDLHQVVHTDENNAVTYENDSYRVTLHIERNTARLVQYNLADSSLKDRVEATCDVEIDAGAVRFLVKSQRNANGYYMDNRPTVMVGWRDGPAGERFSGRLREDGRLDLDLPKYFFMNGHVTLTKSD